VSGYRLRTFKHDVLAMRILWPERRRSHKLGVEEMSGINASEQHNAHCDEDGFADVEGPTPAAASVCSAATDRPGSLDRLSFRMLRTVPIAPRLAGSSGHAVSLGCFSCFPNRPLIGASAIVFDG